MLELESLNEHEFAIDWFYTKENGEITITGYKGDLIWLKIPKLLDDGTKIVKIDSHILSQDKDEFLYVRQLGAKDILPITLSKEHEYTFSTVIHNLTAKNSENCYIFE